MTIIIGGHAIGLQDGSLSLLNRNDRTSEGTIGHGEEAYVNVSNGDLVIQERDAFLPSEGADYDLVRTYNSRGKISSSGNWGWSWSPGVTLASHQDKLTGQSVSIAAYTVTYGDGTTLHFDFDSFPGSPTQGLWVSTDGAGAYETIRVLSNAEVDGTRYILTRADQSQYRFDKNFTLLSIIDTNGVRTDFEYQANNLVRVRDDLGHTLTYQYNSDNQLVRIVDEQNVTLVQYGYNTDGRLASVTNRAGHVTTFTYNTNHLLETINLPSQQTVNGQVQQFVQRQIQFHYQSVPWGDTPHLNTGFDTGNAFVLSEVIDAEGAKTTFGYTFNFAGAIAPDDRDARYQVGGSRFLTGGTTNVVDAAGKTSSYKFDADGYITEVTDALGFKTTYTYDLQDNLTSITDRNGFGATTSDSAYYRALRADLGFKDSAGNGKPVSQLTAAEKSTIAAKFTSTFIYDTRGNLLTSRDQAGNVRTYTYTAFNKVASETSPMGNALATSDDQIYQDKRDELGFAKLVGSLNEADKTTLRNLYTTTYQYDAKQNLIARTDPGGDLTKFEYDAFGNLSKKTVFLDASDLITPSKQQVTTYSYDAFGNNTDVVDGEGGHIHNDYDHFGNLIRTVDARGGVTTNTYDGDNRLVAVVDPELRTTTYAYDAVGNKIGITDANGHTVTQVFNKNNQLVLTIDPSATAAALERQTQFKYDVVGDRTEVTDAEGNKTTYAFDARRQLIDVATPSVLNGAEQLVSYHETYAYDGEGNVVTLTDRNGNVTQNLYTPNGLLKRVTSAAGNVTEYLYDANRQQLQITIGAQLALAQQRRLRFSYDEENQLIAEIDALGGVTRKVYDAPGNVVAITDANNKTTNFEYDRNNRKIMEIRPEVTDPVTGQPVRYTVLHKYDANGSEIQTTDERGNKTKYTFDKDNRRVMLEDRNGIKTVYSYDSRNNATQIAIGVDAHVDANGKVVIDNAGKAQVTTYVYDEFNDLIAKTDGVGNALAISDEPLYQQMRMSLGFAQTVAGLSAADKQALLAKFTERYTYDRNSNELTGTDRLGHVKIFQYDALGRLQSQTETLDATHTRTTAFRYDGNFNLVKMTDALGRTFTYRYDGVERLSETTDSLGFITHYDYDAFGNRVATTQAFGTPDVRTTRFEYDLNNRLSKQIDAEDNAQSYEYDAVGNRLKITDGKGEATQFVYDALNRNVKVIDPLNFETRYEYDATNNRITIVDAKGGVQRLRYDPGNRYIQTTDPEGRVTKLDYDVLGNVVTQTTAFGKLEAQITRFVYDAQGHLRQVTDAAGNVSADDYDADYNRIASTDENGNTTTYGYDALNRQIRVTDALGAVKTFTYDLVDNKLSETNEIGKTTTYTYDADNQLLTQTDPLGVKTQYQYDGVGNKVSITYAAGTPQQAITAFEYDKNNKLVRQTDALGNATDYVYDANLNVETVTDANGNATTYSYDANNRVKTITDPLGKVTTYVYDRNGNRVQVIDPRGSATTTYYNQDNEVILTADASRFATATAYDGNGNVVSRRLYATPLAAAPDPDTLPTPTSSAGDQITTFAYDKLNRIAKRTDALGYATTYRYDGAGNVLETQQQLSLTDATKLAITRNRYDARSRLAGTLTAEGYLTLFEYDAVGNQTRRTAFDGKFSPTAGGGVPTSGSGTSRISTYTYDADGRLVTETSPIGVVTRYEYDFVGNRTAKIEADGTALARRTEVHYDKNNRVFETVDALGTVTRTIRDAAGNETEVHEAFGTPLERVTKYAYDGNNRVIQQTDAKGVVTDFTYDAAGNLITRVSAVGLPDARTESFEYDAKNQLSAQINGEGGRTQYAYDGAGNQIAVVVAPGSPEQRINRSRYDLDNRLIGKIDGNGVETQYRYDGAGNKIETIQLAAAYDSDGNPVTSYGGVPIAGLDRHTVFAYDLDNRLLSVTDPEGGQTKYEYDALGNQTRITDANGTVTQNTYDAKGQLVSNLIVGGEHGGMLVTNQYDAFGNVIRTRKGFGDGADTRQTTYAYDKLDHRILVTEYDKVDQLTDTSVFKQAFSTVFTYDAFGNQTSLSHGVYLLTSTDTGYDAAKAALAHPLNATFVYDKLDQMVSTTDGVGNRLDYVYDNHGNRTQQTTGAGTTDARVVTFTYDKASRLVRRDTQEHAHVVFTYDKAGNQISKSIFDDSGAPARITQYSYDGNGRLTGEVDPLGTQTLHILDAFGNETETRFAAGTADQRSVRAEFNDNDEKVADIDALGNRTQYAVDKMGNRIKETDALGNVTRLYYDNRNQQIATLDPEGFLTSFARDSAGNILQTNVYMKKYTAPSNDLTPPAPGTSDPVRITTSVYDGSNNLLQQTAPDGIVTEYLRNSDGKVVQLTTKPSTDAAAVARTADLTPHVQKFEYDDTGRVIKFTNTDGTIETYTYDTANNRISETVANPNPLPNGATDPVRKTTSRYDHDNRLIQQTTDPDGLKLSETLAYDASGNVVTKTDANGNVTKSAYDLNNRLTSVTDALGNKITFGYDRVGNRTSITDANGKVTNLEYDKNNRVVKETQPAVDVFTIVGGLQHNVRPTTTTAYDAAGNVVQTTDADGFVSTAYYDGNHNKIAEINGDNVLRTFTYDATGAQLTASLYMTRVASSAQNPAVQPTPPTGEVRTVTFEYDAAGRITRTVYPKIDVTTLSGANTSNPSATTASVSPEEKNFYDAFGNRVEFTDRNGSRSLAYFDNRGQAVATVDPAGYLIESSYNDQGKVVQQRKYATALNIASLQSNTRPAAPTGDVFTVDQTYDAANRLTGELSPEVQLDGSRARVLTSFAYDANGNQISKTVAAGTSEAGTEYSYYDAANRKVAVVNAGRVLHLFGFDANGNQTSLNRFFSKVPTSINLNTATLAQIKAAVPADSANDQESQVEFDALNRQTSFTDLMGPGDADNIRGTTQYDAGGNATSRTDATSGTTQTAYDALGHATQTRSPDGNRSFVEYDAAGQKVRAWTGDLGSNQAVQATDVTASIGDDLAIAWNIAGSGLRSYVVYDTTKHNLPADYANKTAQVGSGDVAAHIALTGLAAGAVVYFRVVTVDAAGSTAWTEERSVTIPARLTALSVAQAGNNLEVTVRFNGTITNPVLHFGNKGGALTSTANFVAQADGSFKATIVNPSNPQALAYQVSFSFGGTNYTTSATPFEAQGAHIAVGDTLTWPVPSGAEGTSAANGQFVIVNGVRVDNALQVNHQLEFNPGLTAAGTFVYHVYYGDLVTSQHTVSVTNEDHQSTFVLSDTPEFDTSTPPVQTKRTLVLRWKNDDFHTHVNATLSTAEAASVGSGGVHVAFKTASDTDVFNGGDVQMTSQGSGKFAGTLTNLAAGDYDIQVYYFDTNGKQVMVEWRRITVPAAAGLPADVTVVDTSAPFDFDGQSVTSGGVTDDSFPFELSRAVAVGSTATFTGNSVIVSAIERQGSITRAANGTLTVDPGLYIGALDPTTAPFSAPTTATTSTGAGSLKADGLTTATYFTEILYNALGDKIGSNEEQGLWRRLDVDAKGNVVHTRTFGTRDDETQNKTPIVTFSAFDARDLEIARFSAAVLMDTDGNGTTDATQRSVTRFTYDYDQRMATRLEPFTGAQASQFAYDGVGNLIRQTDPLGLATVMAYDRRGHEVKRTDPLGHVRRKEYDTAGNKIKEIDARGKATLFDDDAFGRVINITDPSNHSARKAYDQHDRLTQETDASNFITHYTYDKRDNLIWTEDANHHFFGQAYDVMGRVTHRYSFQGGNPTSLADAIDAVTNTANARHAFLVDEATSYDIFGNRATETDAEGRQRTFTYGAFGRLVSQSDEGGRVTTFEYDRFGRQIHETRPDDDTTRGAKDIARAYDDAGQLTSVTDQSTDSATSGATTTYTYDAGGRRRHETIKTHAFDASGTLSAAVSTVRNITYGYDGSGRMTSWSDSVTGKNLTYEYDSAGNQTKVSGSGVNHAYTYDENDQILTVSDNGVMKRSFTYDDAGNRKTQVISGVTATFTYDNGNRVNSATNSDGTSATWAYDNVGNIKKYAELRADNTAKFTQTSTYSENNRTLTSETDDQRDTDNKSHTTTTNQLDKSGRLLVETTVDSTDSSNVRTTTFAHTYAADGRELTVTGVGEKVTGASSSSEYDANDGLFSLNLGQGESQEATEIKSFIRGSDGQILTRFHNDGEADTANNTVTQFLYANGNPVGETGNDTTVVPGTNNVTVLDTDAYSLVKNINDKFPTASVSDYVVQLGDNLQIIAGKVYANPSLWFVIAEANGLTGSEDLKEGTRLTIPNTADQGRITADTHVLYKESEIVGSKLPNLKSAPPSDADKCAIAAAIILIILVAIVAVILTVVTVGAAAPAAAAALGVTATSAAGIIIGVAVGAAIGAGIAFAASAISQGILIGFGLQKEFDWKQVAADVVGGAIGGIGAALSGIVQVAVKSAQLATRIGRVISVAVDTALNVAGEVASQTIVGNGRIEQPWMIGVAAAGGIAGELLGELGGRAFRAVKKAAGITSEVASDAAKGGGKVVKFVEPDGTIVSKLSKDLSFKPVDDFSPLKAADTAFVPASSKNKIGINIKNAGEIFNANGKQHGLKPTTWTDDAAASVSSVQSPLKLDVVPNGKTLSAVNDLNAGAWAQFQKKSTVDFAEATVGKVGDKTVPLSDAVAVQPTAVTKNLTADATDLVAVPKQVQPVDLVPKTEPPLTVADTGTGLAKVDVGTAGPPTTVTTPTAPTGVSTPPVTTPSVVSPPPTVTSPPSVTTAVVNSPPKKVQTLANFPNIADTVNDYSKELDSLVAANTYPTTTVRDPALPDYNDIRPDKLADYRQKLEDHLGSQVYQDSIDEIKRRQTSYPEISTADPQDLLAARIYTLEQSPALFGGTALDPGHLVNGSPAGDYRVLNTALRADPINGAAKLTELDPFIRLTSTSLEHFPEYRGPTYRGVDSNFPKSVLDQYQKGAVVVDRAFTSTAVDPKAPFGFSPETLFVTNVRGASNIAAVSKFPDEAEVLFRPNTSFRVLDVQIVPSTQDVFGTTGQVKRIIYLDQIVAT